MRRLTAIAAFALLLAVPLWAQRGGHSGGGFGAGRGGGFAGHAGGFAGGHFSGGSRGAPSPGFGRGFVHSPRAGFNRGPFLHNGSRNWRFRTNHVHTFGFRNPCFGFRCGRGYAYPWWGSAYYDPWWSWEQDDRRFDRDYDRQYEIANEMNEQSLEQQRMLRQEEAAGDQDSYAPRRAEQAADTAPRPESQGQSIISPTVLVFRDQHREEVRNYAIVGDTLWNFAPARTGKISLAQLDLPATEKANDDRGVTFRVPGRNEGQ